MQISEINSALIHLSPSAQLSLSLSCVCVCTLSCLSSEEEKLFCVCKQIPFIGGVRMEFM